MRSAARHLPLLVLAGVVLFASDGCGEARRYGDEGGVPVTFQVHLERAFVNGMRNRQGRVGVGVGAGFSSGGGSAIGTGIGLSFSSTTVYLLGGDALGEAGVFRQELKWGDNAFSVPLKAGRTIQFAVQAQGGREGWEGVGSVVIPDGANPGVTIVAGEAGGKTTVATGVAPPPPK
ncbi:MAG: hypothetical protein H0X38_14245 [Planctomycetes bacterium]|nr:hypothetical protein [Planctomycetota bacterium]